MPAFLALLARAGVIRVRMEDQQEGEHEPERGPPE